MRLEREETRSRDSVLCFERRDTSNSIDPAQPARAAFESSSGKVHPRYFTQLHVFFLFEQPVHERREKDTFVQIRPGNVIGAFPRRG
jgi:hypothetical protein